MKKNVLILYFLLFIFTVITLQKNVTAQSYHSILDTSAIWYQKGWYNNGATYGYTSSKIFYGNDTILDSLKYQKVYITTTDPDNFTKRVPAPYLLRENNDRKVFGRSYDNNLKAYSKEYLLYDFNLALGDTMTYNDSVNKTQMDPFPSQLILQSIDTIEVSGIKLRSFSFSANSYPSHSTWIEGIGCIDRSLLYPYTYHFESGHRTVCFESKAFQWNFSTQNCYYLDVEEKPQFEAIKAYPNPVIDKLYIENIQPGVAFRVFNSNGHQIQSGQIDVSNTVDFSNMSRGIYLVVLYANDLLITRILSVKE